MSAPPLRRILGPSTTVLVGIGVALGSGILRTPPLVAGTLGSAYAVIGAWLLGGLIILASSLIMAELATRYPASGGEYVWLREAFGPFVAFFFGWGYTLFIVGGGAATIAAAFGDAAVQLFGDFLGPRSWAGLAVIAVTGANMVGLRAGAGLQNILTVAKVLVVLVGVGVAFTLPRPEVVTTSSLSPGLTSLIAVLPPVIWAYAGSTDVVKLAGEVERPEVVLPRALVATTGILAAIYVVVNLGLLYALGVEGLARSPLPLAEVVRRAVGPSGQALVAAASALVFLGALSSTILATVRVAWALGRDRQGLGFLGEMNAGQAPVGALAMVGGIALFLALARDFDQILGIYFFASAILFGLVYASLFVFRARERAAGTRVPGVFRCPVPWLLVGIMIAVQGAMAILVVIQAPGDAAATLGLLAVVALGYRASKSITSV